MTHGRSTQLLSCRVPDSLPQWVREQARRETTTVSEFIGGVLERERQGRVTTPGNHGGILARFRELLARLTS